MTTTKNIRIKVYITVSGQQLTFSPLVVGGGGEKTSSCRFGGAGGAAAFVSVGGGGVERSTLGAAGVLPPPPSPAVIFINGAPTSTFSPSCANFADTVPSCGARTSIETLSVSRTTTTCGRRL